MLKTSIQILVIFTFFWCYAGGYAAAKASSDVVTTTPKEQALAVMDQMLASGRYSGETGTQQFLKDIHDNESTMTDQLDENIIHFLNQRSDQDLAEIVAVASAKSQSPAGPSVSGAEVRDAIAQTDKSKIVKDAIESAEQGIKESGSAEKFLKDTRNQLANTDESSNSKKVIEVLKNILLVLGIAGVIAGVGFLLVSTFPLFFLALAQAIVLFLFIVGCMAGVFIAGLTIAAVGYVIGTVPYCLYEKFSQKKDFGHCFGWGFRGIIW